MLIEIIMNNLILGVHVIKLILQIFFLNLMRQAKECSCKTPIPDGVLFNGHLVSIALPLLIRMRPELGIPSCVFHIALVIMSAIYCISLWFGKCKSECEKLNKMNLQVFCYFYGINAVIASLMVVGIVTYTMTSSNQITV